MNRPPAEAVPAAAATLASQAAAAKAATTAARSATTVARTVPAAAKTAVVAAVTKTTATAGIWPWVSAGVLGLVAGSAVVLAARATVFRRPPEPAPPAAVAAPEAPQITPLPETTGVSDRPGPVTAPGARKRAARSAPGDLAGQVGLLDAARTAVASGADTRALELLRRYEERYPEGSFRPEVTALKVEALLKLGRSAEARSLATRFVAEHRGTLLARRVAKLAGLPSR